MRSRTKAVNLILFGILVFLLACGKQSTEPVLEKGTLQISLTDAPAAYDEVNILFSEISAHIDGQWISVNTDQQTINLLQWNNGKSIVIGEADVPAGHYSQIRLIIDDANVVVSGQTYQMDVPSGAKTGLKFGPEFDIGEGSTYELVVDFDAERSVVITGPRQNPTGYKLQPRIRVVPKAVTGSISGNLDKSYDSPVAYAIIPSIPGSNAEPDTVTSSVVDELTNTFMLSFLPEGSYDVRIVDATDQYSHTEQNVEVVVGANKDIGQLILQ